MLSLHVQFVNVVVVIVAVVVVVVGLIVFAAALLHLLMLLFSWLCPLSCMLLQEGKYEIPGLNYVHDLAVTPSFYIVHQTPFVKAGASQLTALEAT